MTGPAPVVILGWTVIIAVAIVVAVLVLGVLITIFQDWCDGHHDTAWDVPSLPVQSNVRLYRVPDDAA